MLGVTRRFGGLLDSSRTDERLWGALAHALAHAQAHVFAPVSQALGDGGQRAYDVLVVPGERHGIVLAVARSDRRKHLAEAEGQLDGPVDPIALSQSAPTGVLDADAAVLKAIVVLRSRHRRVWWIASGDGGVPVVPLRVLVAALRDRDHPDEVWRELADGAGGWPPTLAGHVRQAAQAGALAPRQRANLASGPRTWLRPSENRRAKALLARVQGPPPEAWVSHEVVPGQLRLWNAEPPALLTVPNRRRRPEIVVMAVADGLELLAPAAALAEGLRHSLDQLCQRRPGRASLRRIVPRNRVVMIELVLAPLANDVERYVPASQPPGCWWIRVGVSASHSHQDGQALLLTVARAATDALLTVGAGPTAARSRAAERLLHEWALLPQALDMRTEATPAWSGDRFGAWGPPGAGEDRTVDRMLSTAAARRALAPGVRTGAEAQGILRVLADDLLLEALALTGGGDRAVFVCADQLHRAVAARLDDHQHTAASMTGPWWQEHLPSAAAVTAAAPAHTGAAELLLENALRRPSTNDGPMPDRPAWRLASAAAARARVLATLATADYRRLSTTSVCVGEDLTVTVTDAVGPTDLRLYTALRALTSITDMVGERPSEPLDGGSFPVDREFQRLTDIPEAESLRPIDDALRHAVGAGLDAIVGTLVTAADHLPTTGLALRSDVLEDAVAYTGLPRDEIDAAIDWLTLRRDHLRAVPFEYWKLEARSVRLAAQPLICPSDDPAGAGHLLLVPGRIRLTQLMYLSYLEDGRLPIPRAILRQPHMKALSDELNRHRQRMNKQQEGHAHRLAEQEGLLCRRDLDPRKTAKFGLTIRGQIDLLVAVPATRRIWVAEVKDPAHAFSLWEMADEIDDFHGGASDTGTHRRQRDEVGRLLEKTADIAEQIPATLKVLGLAGPTDGWEARPIMLTRRLTPAAFVADPRVPFALVRQVAEALRSPDLEPGPYLWFPTSGGDHPPASS